MMCIFIYIISISFCSKFHDYVFYFFNIQKDILTYLFKILHLVVCQYPNVLVHLILCLVTSAELLPSWRLGSLSSFTCKVRL